MADQSRVFDGFADLSRGMDGGKSPSLLFPNQVAEAINATFRGSFLKTRPPFWNLQFTYESAETLARFTGKFQGGLFYQGIESALIVSMGGRLFRIETDETHLVTEITPRLTIVVTAGFTVPALNATVIVQVTSETVLTIGLQVKIDSGTYTVTNRFANAVELQYNGGAANATVAAGAGITYASNGLPVQEIRENPADLDFIYLFQAENYVIILAGQQRVVIYDGSTSRLAEITGEIPPGVLGAYVWGRIWIVLPDFRTFMAGDLVHTNSLGDFSDILKFTENDFWNEGGTFSIPVNAGTITALQALATQDNSLGQGNLLVGTTNSIFSVNTPVDRTTWKNLTFPIQTVALIDYGPTGPRWIPQVNGDWWYRALDGYRSFIVARREIQVWGNTPMSREIEPATDIDTDSLLFFGSAILFDNRLLGTISPYSGERGIAHRGLSVLNFDLVSNIQGKAPPAWDGVWSGLQILQLVKGNVDRRERGFAFVANDSCFEIWEIKRAKEGYYDQVTNWVNNQRVITRVPIQASINSRSMDFASPVNLKGLRMAEFYIDEIVDDVTLTIKFRPDQYPNWIDWASLQICVNVSQCTIQAPEDSVCHVWKPHGRGYAARILLPQPPETCNELAGLPIDRAFEFQFRLEWQGSIRIRRFRPHGNLIPVDQEGECPAEVQCKTIESCGVGLFDYSLPMCS